MNEVHFPLTDRKVHIPTKEIHRGRSQIHLTKCIQNFE